MSDAPGSTRAPDPPPWVRLIVAHLLIPLVLLICAGDLAWWQAWGLSALIVGAGVGGRVWAERRHPGILAERARYGAGAAGVKPWDRLLAPLMAFTISFALVVVAGLDHRFGWSPALPVWLSVAGLIVTAVGYAFAAWAMVENRFFSGVVRIQTDRGHAVCDSGPYAIVRHPGYAGSVLSLPGVALALGSSWALVPAAAALGIALIRTGLEDRTLQEELPGYREYATRVRHRWLPGIY